MTRLRLMRACRSHSKNENSGTKLSFSDIVNFCTAGGGESARTTLGGSALKLLDAGDLRRGVAERDRVPSSRRDDKLEAKLQRVLNLFGILLEIS
jgi:hypothetical protein